MHRKPSAIFWSGVLLFLLNAGTSEASFIHAAGEAWRPANSGSMSVPEAPDANPLPTENQDGEPADADAFADSILSWNSFKTGGSMGGNSVGSSEGGQNSFCGLFYGDEAVRLELIGWLRYSRLAKFVPPPPMTLLRPPRPSAASFC